MKRQIADQAANEPMAHLGVEHLVRRAASGDAEAWSVLVSRFAGLVWSIARAHGLKPSQSADVSQTTWLRFAEHLDRLREPERAGSWLATTARREAAKVSRDGRREMMLDPWEDVQPIDYEALPEDALLAQERQLQVQRAVALLPERCRDLLLALAADEPLPYSELSIWLDMPLGSIGPTRGRCLRHLRHLLEELDSVSLPRK